MHFKFRQLLLILILSISISETKAQQNENLQFTRIDKTSGLSSNNIAALCTDHLGFNWVGTTDGLFRIETKDRIKVYKKGPTNSLKSNNIKALLSDSQGNLWIGTRLGGLTKFHQKSGTWQTFQHDENSTNSISNNDILSLLEDHQGRIWIGTENGLNLFDPREENFHRFLPNKKNNQALQAKAVLSVYEDRDNRIWIGTWAGGLHLMLPAASGQIEDSYFKQFRINEHSPQALNIWKIFQDNKGRFWIGTHGDGLFLMQLPNRPYVASSAEEWKPKFHNFQNRDNNETDIQISGNTVIDIIQNKNNDLWLSTANGLNIINSSHLPDPSIFNTPTSKAPTLRFRKYFFRQENTNSIPHNSIYGLNIDHQGMIWLGTLAGLCRYQSNNSAIENYPIRGFDIKQIVSQNLYVDPSNIAWLGLTDKGIIRYDITNQKILPVNKKFRIPRKSKFNGGLFCKDSEHLYMGTRRGFEIANLKTLQVQTFDIPNPILQKLNKFNIQSIFVDQEKRIWIGTTTGLVVYYPKSQTFHLYQNDILDHKSISDNSITQIFQSKNNQIWISTYNGLNLITAHNGQAIQFHQFRSHPKVSDFNIPSNQVTAICESNNKLFLGLSTGICSYDFTTKKFKKVNPNKEQYFITSLASFDNKYLWATTTEGIIITNLETNQRFELNESDGLFSRNFVLEGISVGPNDKVYFSSMKGIVGIHPNNLTSNKNPPPVYITNIKTLSDEGEKVYSGISLDTLTLSSSDYYLSLNFAALNFHKEKKNQYAYQLEGFEDKFIESNRTIATYTNLDHGEYTFKVIAANNDGVWNQKGAKIFIKILPAFYETALFKATASALLLLIIISGFNIYTRNVRHRNKHMTKLVDQRTKELATKKKEVEDLLGQIQNRNNMLEKLVIKRTRRLKESNSELKRSNLELEQFAYIASHDLQEPLRTIGSFANLFGRKYKDKLDTEAYEYIEFIVDAAERMSQQIKSILTYSKVGKKELNIKNKSLNTILELNLLDLSQIIQEKGVNIDIAPLPNINCEIGQIGMLFYNLINNGIKFNGNDKPFIVIKQESHEQEGFWKFSVTDNGIGIDKKYQSKIFDIFTRLNLKTEYEGTGIGLALCQKIVARHHGEIWVESEYGKGTTFFFTIKKDLQNPVIPNAPLAAESN